MHGRASRLPGAAASYSQGAPHAGLNPGNAVRRDIASGAAVSWQGLQTVFFMEDSWQTTQFYAVLARSVWGIRNRIICRASGDIREHSERIETGSQFTRNEGVSGSNPLVGSHFPAPMRFPSLGSCQQCPQVTTKWHASGMPEHHRRRTPSPCSTALLARSPLGVRESVVPAPLCTTVPLHHCRAVAARPGLPRSWRIPAPGPLGRGHTDPP